MVKHFMASVHFSLRDCAPCTLRFPSRKLQALPPITHTLCVNRAVPDQMAPPRAAAGLVAALLLAGRAADVVRDRPTISRGSATTAPQQDPLPCQRNRVRVKRQLHSQRSSGHSARRE